MEEYRHNVFRSYLEKEPGKYLKPVKTQVTKQVKELTILKPEVTAVEFHEYPNEHVVVLEGNNLWFCHQIRIGETDNIQEINTPAQNITRQSIQFSFTPSRKTKNIVSIDGKVKIALYSHFANPIRRKITVKQVSFVMFDTLRLTQSYVITFLARRASIMLFLALLVWVIQHSYYVDMQTRVCRYAVASENA